MSMNNAKLIIFPHMEQTNSDELINEKRGESPLAETSPSVVFKDGKNKSYHKTHASRVLKMMF